MKAKHILCKNGHAFDVSKTSICPVCGVSVANEGVTMPAVPLIRKAVAANQFQTAVVHAEGSPARSCEEMPTRPAWWSESEKGQPGEMDLSGVKDHSVIEPVVGWLLSIAGPTSGRDYRIFTGNNSIGRAPEMRICINGDDAISREKHAFIVYDPKSIRFLLRLGDSQGLVYLNEKLVTETSELQAYDMIELGQTKLLFIPACCEKFKW